MGLIIKDRVKDTSTTTGTGDITVSGTAPTGFRAFDDALATSDTSVITIQHQTADEWEICETTYSGSNVLTRGTLLASSTGSRVDFSAGTKDVWIDLAADKSYFKGRRVDISDAGVGVGYGDASATVPTRAGFFLDDDTTTQIHRFRDRIFFGDAVKYTGRRTAPYGGDWSVEEAASYFIKNSQVAVLSSEGRIGLLCGSYSPSGSGSLVDMGLCAITVNDSESGTSRAGYFEAFHKGNANATTGIEVQGGNYSENDYTANAYLVEGGYVGMQIAVEAGYGYTVGDDGTAVTAPTNPGTCAIDVSGGAEAQSYQKWNAGIVFRDGAIVRDGSGIAVAISMAQGHEFRWQISSTDVGASIRSDVSTAGKAMSIVFGDDVAQFFNGDNKVIGRMQSVASAANYCNILAAASGSSPSVGAAGDDTNIGVNFRTKGSGEVQFYRDSGSVLMFRVRGVASGANYLSPLNAIAGAPPELTALGSDTNIDLKLTPRGSGNVRFGTFTSGSDAAVNGYVTIKDAGGTTRKLATIA